MQVTSINPTTVEIEPPSGNHAPADSSGDGGFAAMLAKLLGAASDDAKAAADLGEIEAVPAEDESDKSDDAVDPTAAAIAMAAAAAVPQPATSAPSVTTAESTDSTTIESTQNTGQSAPALSTTTIEVEAPPAEGFVQPPVEAPVPGASAPKTAPQPRAIERTDTSPPSPTLQSAAEYTVLPRPAEGTPKAAAAANAQTQAAVAAPVASPSAASAVAVQSAAVLNTEATPATESHADDAEDDNLLAGAAKSAALRAGSTKSDAAEPPAAAAPDPVPVLEKNTPVLARNALRENLRDSSSRELLASAREPEHAEKPTESTAPNALPNGDAAQRMTLRTANGAQPQRNDAAHTLTSSLPTLGDDLVKHVTLHAGPGERTLTLKLLPESLGEVQVEVKSSLDNVTVRLISQDPSVRQALEHHANGLREALASDGRETRVEIGSQLMSNMGQANDGAWTSRQAQQDPQDRPRWFAQPSVSSEPVPQAAKRLESRPAEHAGVLNLFA